MAEPIYSSTTPDYHCVIGYIDYFDNEYRINDTSGCAVGHIKDGEVLSYDGGWPLGYLDGAGKIFSNAIRSDCTGFVDTDGKIYSTPYAEEKYCMGCVADTASDSVRAAAAAAIPLLFPDCERPPVYTSSYNGGSYGRQKNKSYEEIIKENQRRYEHRNDANYALAGISILLCVVILLFLIFKVFPHLL